MNSLPAGKVFVLPTAYDGRNQFRVTIPAADNGGWVHVRDLSMSDERAGQLLAGGGFRDDEDPRDGLFNADQAARDVEVLS
jgi:hypothetical protein